jgi:hypothetical protein
MPSVRASDAAQAPPNVGAPVPTCAQPAVGPSNVPLGDGPVVSVTSHTLSLSTRAFSVDFTWSRVETGQPGASPTAAADAATPSESAPRRARRPAQSFQEILRRQQLAQLLVVVPPTPRDAVLLSQAETPAHPQARPVCRAYTQAQGPLAHSSLLFSA